MKQIISTIAKGSVGIGSVEFIPELAQIITPETTNFTTAIVQVIIALATLFGLFKKKK